MKNIINQLIQLQELILTRDEHRTTGDGSHLDALNASIDRMADELPVNIRGLYSRLYQRDHTFMSPLHDGCCAVCGMRLPIGLVQAVRQATAIQYCPSCARLLCEEEDMPRWVGERASRTDPRKTGISRFSAPGLMLPKINAATKPDAIAQIAGLMQSARFIDSAEKLTQGVLEREAILPTVMEAGLAFPHLRGVEGGGLTLAVATSAKGIPFDENGTPANLIFLVTIPAAVSAFYLRLVAGLTAAFAKAANRDAMFAANTPDELWKALSKATRYTIK
ncbi:MAG: PTS sugar transporter subunit IIA [Kiritimatiellaeota bacterium]|nr:PTS sugar transporter subunit IIA [Kiritimatiellota bacterium]